MAGLLCLMAQAIPADPTPATVTQPDGQTLTVTLHGDEFFHFTTTSDGYTVVKNAAGFYTYARLEDGKLVASDFIARDVAKRTPGELAFLAGQPKRLTSKSGLQAGKQMLSRRNSAMRRVGADGYMDYDNFRGLIILINYTDKKFSMNDANGFYNDMVNTHDYKGYYNNNGRFVRMTGSVRDYYYDNSNQIFDPHFDIVGPVDVPFACTYPGGTSASDAVFNAALEAVDPMVDFSEYDSDGDGYVDMVFFLVAGFSANYSGNNENYLWPHMYYLYYTPWRDNVGFGLYACSTEIAGWEGYRSDVNGIGTFCHEFSHVLGLPDLYDTDYSGSGGESRNPGDWSIMASGSGNNYGRNPVGYSLYERYALGFSTPVVINDEGPLTILPLDESNLGYRLNTPNSDEFFLIENRQAGKWDVNLPGHGMLVARVDSTEERIWWMNEVNCNPQHMYYELLRASYAGGDTPNDPFPGNAGVTSLTNYTTPNLLTWNKSFNSFGFFDIAENNGVITLNVEADNSIITVVEDFEGMPETSDQNAKDVKGVFCSWDFAKCAVESVSVPGGKAVAMKKPSQITTSKAINIIPYMVRFTVNNPTGTEAKFRFSYSPDGGENWISPYEGQITVPAKESVTASVNLPIDAPLMLRVNMTSGSNKSSCYLDDIKLYYKDTWAPEYMIGDVNCDGEIGLSDVNAVIAILAGSPDDELLQHADVNGDGEVNIADVNAIISLLIGN